MLTGPVVIAFSTPYDITALVVILLSGLFFYLADYRDDYKD
jgi:hypothetical protein